MFTRTALFPAPGMEYEVKARDVCSLCYRQAQCKHPESFELLGICTPNLKIESKMYLCRLIKTTPGSLFRGGFVGIHPEQTSGLLLLDNV